MTYEKWPGAISGVNQNMEFIVAPKERGVLINRQGGQRVRMLTHPRIDSEDVEGALKVVGAVAEKLATRC